MRAHGYRPSYIANSSLNKNLLLRTDRVIPIDLRLSHRHMVASQPAHVVVTSLYPRMYALHKMGAEDGLVVDDRVVLPPVRLANILVLACCFLFWDVTMARCCYRRRSR